MNRFIVINNCLVNVRHIVMAVDEADGTTAFHLDNGEVLHTQSSPELDDALMGIKHTVGIIPVRGLNAIMDDGSRQFQLPVRYLELTRMGPVIPWTPTATIRTGMRTTASSASWRRPTSANSSKLLYHKSHYTIEAEAPGRGLRTFILN